MNTPDPLLSPELLESIAIDLLAYRGNGKTDVIFDGRDHGNYSAYSWDRTVKMLAKADPTGLCAGMLLNEMIAATIHGSTVNLERVLLEDGFIDKLAVILDIKARLLSRIDEPISVLVNRINVALDANSDGLGQASTREVAICLRDAIYSIEKGLKLRWLVCDDVAMPAVTPLCNVIPHFADLAEFADALRHTLSWGAHLARIGIDKTAVGIKQPGRIGFLSSMGLNTLGGGMYENRASGHHMAESLDLDTAVERYPVWIEVKTSNSYSSKTPVVVDRDTHTLNRLSTLPRDVLIWFAMLVEIASQRMANAKSDEVELAENMARALPAGEAAHVQSTSVNLPMVIQPNWIAAELTIDSALKNLRFTPWELDFLAPALTQIAVSSLLPFGSEEMTLSVETGFLNKLLKPLNQSSFEKYEYWQRNVKITPIHPNWVGTRIETEAARKSIFERNLALYLMTWGNLRFGQAWQDSKSWFKERLTANLPYALGASCAMLVNPGSMSYPGVHLYNQSAKHKTYNARCIFNAKSLVTHSVLFNPQTDLDLVEMLGLHSTNELPEFLRGWSRFLGWTVQDFPGHDTNSRPVDVFKCWDFSKRQPYILVASVCLNINNVPFDLRHKLTQPTKADMQLQGCD